MVKFAMMPNGDLSRCRGSVLLENTTAIDVILSIIMCLTLDKDDFRMKINEIADADFVKFIEDYITLGTAPKVIRDRNLILSKFFTTGIVSKAKVMNCESTVVEITNRIWVTLFKAKCLCQNFLNVSLDNTVLKLPPCNKKHALQNIIFVEANGENMSHQSIPEVLLINEQMFVLNAVVLQSNHGNHIHFFADIKRENFAWYRFDNTTRTISKSKLSEKVRLVHMLCYICCSKPNHTPTEVRNEEPFEIIKNFSSINYNGINVLVENSCGPDSLLHIFCQIFISSPKLFQCNDMSDLLLDLANAYKAKDAQNVYQLRIKILMQHGFKCKMVLNRIVLDATSNIESCVRMIFSHNFYSAIRTSACKCHQKPVKMTLVGINTSELQLLGIDKLESCLISKNQKSQSICKKCKENVTVETEYSPLIFIDIQPMTKANETFQLPALYLHEFPRQIEIQSKNYKLRGVIEHIHATAHFTAHFLKFGIFYEYNDLYNEVKPSTDQKVNAHMLICTEY